MSLAQQRIAEAITSFYDDTAVLGLCGLKFKDAMVRFVRLFSSFFRLQSCNPLFPAMIPLVDPNHAPIPFLPLDPS
mgnify:CR=1 FL=1